MILVTGGTGFVGRALIRHLVESGRPVRTLIRPSLLTPNLPKGVPVEVAVSSLNDIRGVRAAMVGVDTIYHLASVERQGAYADMMEVDVQGTRAVIDAAVDAGIDRIFFVSHLDADRASAYPVMKFKAIAEEHIRRSGLDYTILRTGIVYGPNDGFTTGLARLMVALPFIFLMPGDGKTLLQPLWVEDLVTCLTWSLDDDRTRKMVYEIGGPEYLTFAQVLELIKRTLGIRRRLINIRPVNLRNLAKILESIFPSLPVSIYLLDYLAANRTCALDTIPRVFSLMPARMAHHLAYLQGENWSRSLRRALSRRREPAQ